MVVSANDTFKIINEYSQLVLEVEGEATTEGTRIEQYTDTGKDHQWWRLKPAGPGNDGFYNIENVRSAMSLEVVGYSKDTGAEIVQRPYSDGPLHRQWELVPVAGKTDVYKIVNRNSGLVLDDVRGQKDAPAPVKQYESWNDDGRQQWKLILVATDTSGQSAIITAPPRIPIYQYSVVMRDGSGLRFMYSPDPNYTSGWTRDIIAFYAHAQQFPETVPIYQYSVAMRDGSGLRFMYSPDPNYTSGWTRDIIAFYAFPGSLPSGS
ncbi:MAG: RICIN domain-containing protein [Pseudonocardiaceae bacterium]